MFGLRSAFNHFTPLPPEKADALRQRAAEFLARHVKIRDGSYLAESKFSNSRVWLEMRDLQLHRISTQTLSQADQANGTLESYRVQVDFEMHRTYDKAAAKWAEWRNGKSVYAPNSILVERQANGQWRVGFSGTPTLIAHSTTGDPSIIPHASPTAPAPASLPIQIPAAPAAAPIPASKHLVLQSVATPPPMAAYRLIPFGLFALLGMMLLLIVFVRKSKRRGRFQSPVPLDSRVGSMVGPPPLPSSEPTNVTNDSNGIELFSRKETLMTPAEQAFFAVLLTVISPSYMVSSKVRLADLFAVRQQAGQQAAFNRIRSKHIDFVLTETGTSRILCAIELDDSSHQLPDRVERDEFINELFAATDLPLMRVPVAWSYQPQILREQLIKAGIPIS